MESTVSVVLADSDSVNRLLGKDKQIHPSNYFVLETACAEKNNQNVNITRPVLLYTISQTSVQLIKTCLPSNKPYKSEFSSQSEGVVEQSLQLILMSMLTIHLHYIIDHGQ